MSRFEPVYSSSAPDAKYLETIPPWHFLSTDDECPVCTENRVGVTCKTICGHIYHNDCLFDWWRSLERVSSHADLTCPMCRKVLAILTPLPQLRWEDDVDDDLHTLSLPYDELVDEEEGHKEEDGDYLAMRIEAEQELQYHYSRLCDFQATLQEDEKSLSPPPTMYGGVARPAREDGLLEGYTWSREEGRFVPTRSLGVEEEMATRRRVYRTKVLIGDALEGLGKLTALVDTVRLNDETPDADDDVVVEDWSTRVESGFW